MGGELVERVWKIFADPKIEERREERLDEAERKQAPARPRFSIMQRLQRIEGSEKTRHAFESDQRPVASGALRPREAVLSIHEQREQARNEIRGYLSAVKLTEFFDLSAVGIKDTQRFMSELMAEAFAGKTPEQREAMRQGFMHLVGEKGSMAEMFRKTFSMLGPAYIKFMQILATQPGAIKEKYRDAFASEFRNASDSNTWVPIGDLYHVLDHDVPDWRSKFRSIEPEPFAVGSMGQVHDAVLADGTKVVVKIMRPGAEDLEPGARTIQDIIKREAPDSQLLAHLTSTLVEDAQNEIDFRIEGKVANRMRAEGVLQPPEVHDAASGRRVLAQEKLDGPNLSKLRGELDAHPDAKRAAALADQLSEKVIGPMRTGLVYQADPSLGNFIVTEGDSLRPVDIGKHGSLGATAPLFDAVLETLVNVGEKKKLSEGDAKALTAVLSRLFGEETYSQAIYESVKQGGTFTEMLERLMSNKNISVPKELTSALKTCVQWEGAAKLLNPSFDAAKFLGDMYAKERSQRLPADVRLLQIELSRALPAGTAAPAALEATFVDGLGDATKVMLGIAQKYPSVGAKMLDAKRVGFIHSVLQKAIRLWQAVRGRRLRATP